MDVPVFLEALTPAQHALVRSRSRVRLLDRKEIAFFEGERRAHPSVILDGFMRLERGNPDGSRAVLALRGPGEIIGEMPTLDGGPQPTEANALTAAEILTIPTWLFEDVLAANPMACAAVAMGLAQQLRWAYEVCSDRVNGVAKSRVAGRILDIADVLGVVRDGAVEMVAPISQADLAGMAGVCRESATRVIGDLRRTGAIAYSGRRLRILRPDMLEKIKCAGRDAGSCRSRREEGSRRSQPLRDA
jgi:CRP-like cAMP-binding protein